jgi:hypothetical protein
MGYRDQPGDGAIYIITLLNNLPRYSWLSTSRTEMRVALRAGT